MIWHLYPTIPHRFLSATLTVSATLCKAATDCHRGETQRMRISSVTMRTPPWTEQATPHMWSVELNPQLENWHLFLRLHEVFFLWPGLPSPALLRVNVQLQVCINILAGFNMLTRQTCRRIRRDREKIGKKPSKTHHIPFSPANTW